LDIRKNFYTEGVVRHWIRLPRDFDNCLHTRRSEIALVLASLSPSNVHSRGLRRSPAACPDLPPGPPVPGVPRVQDGPRATPGRRAGSPGGKVAVAAPPGPVPVLPPSAAAPPPGQGGLRGSGSWGADGRAQLREDGCGEPGCAAGSGGGGRGRGGGR